MKSWLVRITLAAAIAAMFSSCNSVIDGPPATVRAAMKPEKSRKPAPEFSLKDSGGKTVKLSDYKGKIVLLNFWATWCGPCKIEIPWFMDFEQEYKDRGFAVLGVSMDDDGWATVKPYIEDHKVNYRVLLGNDIVGGLYGGVESLPTTFVIDRDGRIASIHIGLVSKNEYQNEISNLLEDAKSTSDAGRRSTVSDLLARAK